MDRWRRDRGGRHRLRAGSLAGASAALLVRTVARAVHTVCFTSFSYSYLPRARVLAETLRAAHRAWPLWAVVVDRPPPGFAALDAFAGFDCVLDADQLGIPRFRAWLFKHELVEACTAVKAAMLQHLLALGAERVIYFDPDIAVFHPLTALDDQHAVASVVLTPHQADPNDSPIAVGDNELSALRYGIFNLGFLAVRNDESGRAFAAWWAARLHEACYDGVAHGLFTDQKYCDLAPALFDGVAIARDRGWNVASWNLSRRRLRVTDDGAITVNGWPLAFYHFTKHGGVGDEMTERYAGAGHEPHELWRWYGRRLAAHAAPAISPGWWHYATYSDGTPIQKATRHFYRQRPDLLQSFDDPFDVAGDSLRAWLQANAPEALADVSGAIPPATAGR
jgi:hypothetical protein